MANWVSSITLAFKDQFSSGFMKATSQINKGQQQILDGANEIKNGSGIMGIARDMSIVSMQVSQFASSIQSTMAVPGKIASSFEDGMARVSTVLNESNATGGDTAGSMDEIRRAAERMAGGLGQAGELAAIGTDVFSNSVYTMLSSGLSVQQGIAATEQAALLAKATGGSMADAASALTGIFNNLGDKSADAQKEMTRLSDVVAGTQNYFAFENLEQFTAGLKNVSGIAVSNEIPLTQISAAVGQLNTNMIKGPEAGTALKSIIAQLGNASERLGFEIARTADGGIDLINTFQNIKATGADGLAMTKAFGTEAGPAIGLLTEKLDELSKGYDYVNDAAGITLSNASKMAETLSSRQERLSAAMQVWQGRMGVGANAVKGFGITLKMGVVQFGNWASTLPVVGGALSGVIGGATQLTGSFAGLTAGALQTSTGLVSMVGLIEKGPAILSTFKGGISMVSGSLGFLKTGIKSSIMSIIGMGKSFIASLAPAITWMSTMWGVAAAHIAAAWPIYAIVAGIAAVIGITVLLVKNWDKVSAWVSGFWTKIKGFFSAGFGFIKGLFTESSGWVQGALLVFMPLVAIPMQIVKHWDTLKSWFASFADWISPIAQKIIAPFKAIGSFFGNLFGKQESPVLSTMAQGIGSDNSLYKVTENSFRQVDRLIPHSDAKEGPFSRLTDAGRAIPETMARGMQGSSLKGSASQAFSGMPLSQAGVSGPGPAKVENHYTINVTFDEIREFPSLMEYLAMLKEETEREAKLA